jgi:hypothetical protein
VGLLFLESVSCGVCATVSAIGCCADVLSLCTYYVPGANFSSVVVVPVSVGKLLSGYY